MRDPRLTNSPTCSCTTRSGSGRARSSASAASRSAPATLLEAVYEAVLKAGGHPLPRCALDGCTDIFLQTASEEQLKHVSPIALAEVNEIDADIALWADVNTKSATGVDPKLTLYYGMNWTWK